jgi:flagellar hook-length control protein FliK
MDDYGIKSGPGRETPPFAGTTGNSPKGNGFVASLGGLAATFTDLIQKMGSRMSADASKTTANTVPPVVTERAQEPAPADRRDYRDDRGRDRIETRDRPDEPRSERADSDSDTAPTARTDNRDSGTNERQSDTNDTAANDQPHDAGRDDSSDQNTNAENPASRSDESNDAAANDQPHDAGRDDSSDQNTNAENPASRSDESNDAAANDQPHDAGRDDSSDQNTNAENPASRSDESNDAGGDTTAQNNGETVAQTGNQPGADANGAQQRAQQIIAGLTAGLQGAARTDQGAARTDLGAHEGKAQTGDSAHSDKTLQNLVAAAATDGKGNTAIKAGVHHAEQGPQSQTAAQKAAEGQNNGQTQAQFQNQNHAKTGTEGANRNAAAEAVKATDGATRQADELARMIGRDNRAQIQVSVKDEAAALVSKPAATLAPTGIGAGDTATPAQHGQQAAAGAANATAAAAQQGSGQSTQQASQQQGANQGNQIQAASGEAKGPAQAGVHTGQGSQASSSAGGEPQATTGTSQPSETAQANKAQAAQATTAPQRPQVHNQGFVDQISVNITKALREGMDKINIQLRPAALGRIDVQLEVGHDGRISAVVTADNKDTLDLLQRDARGLEKALQDAGLQADAGSMSFNLRKQGDEGQEAPQSTVRGDGNGDDGDDSGDRLEAILSAERSRGGVNADGRVDFWA